MLFAVSTGMHCDVPASLQLARDLTINLCLHSAPTVNLSRRYISESQSVSSVPPPVVPLEGPAGIASPVREAFAEFDALFASSASLRKLPTLVSDSALRKRSTLLRNSAPVLLLIIDFTWFLQEDSLLELYYILRSVILSATPLVVPILDSHVVHATNELLRRQSEAARKGHASTTSPPASPTTTSSVPQPSGGGKLGSAISTPAATMSPGGSFPPQQRAKGGKSARNAAAATAAKSKQQDVAPALDAVNLAARLEGTFAADGMTQIVPWIARALFFLTTDLSTSDMTAKLLNLVEELQLTTTPIGQGEGRGATGGGSGAQLVTSGDQRISEALLASRPALGARLSAWDLYEKAWAILQTSSTNVDGSNNADANGNNLLNHTSLMSLSMNQQQSDTGGGSRASTTRAASSLSSGAIVKKPNSGVAQLLRSLEGSSLATIHAVTKLSFRNLAIGDLGVRALCIALQFTVPCLSLLDLSGNSIRDLGCQSICDAFKDHPSLENLLLESNLITAGGASSLFFLLEENTQIVGLTLFRNVVEVTSRVWIRRLVRLLRRNRAFLEAPQQSVAKPSTTVAPHGADRGSPPEEEDDPDCDPRLLTIYTGGGEGTSGGGASSPLPPPPSSSPATSSASHHPHGRLSSRWRSLDDRDLDDYFFLGDSVLRLLPQWHCDDPSTLEGVKMPEGMGMSPTGGALNKTAAWVDQQQQQEQQQRGPQYPNPNLVAAKRDGQSSSTKGGGAPNAVTMMPQYPSPATASAVVENRLNPGVAGTTPRAAAATTQPPSSSTAAGTSPSAAQPLPKCGTVLREASTASDLSVTVTARHETITSSSVGPQKAPGAGTVGGSSGASSLSETTSQVVVELHVQLESVGVDLNATLRGGGGGSAATGATKDMTPVTLDHLIVAAVKSLLELGSVCHLLNVTRVNGTKLPLNWGVTSSATAPTAVATTTVKAALKAQKELPPQLSAADAAQRRQQAEQVASLPKGWGDLVHWNGRAVILHPALTNLSVLHTASLPPATCQVVLQLVMIWLCQYATQHAPTALLVPLAPAAASAQTQQGGGGPLPARRPVSPQPQFVAAATRSSSTLASPTTQRDAFADAFWRFIALASFWETEDDAVADRDSETAPPKGEPSAPQQLQQPSSCEVSLPTKRGRIAQSVPVSMRIASNLTDSRTAVSASSLGFSMLSSSKPGGGGGGSSGSGTQPIPFFLDFSAIVYVAADCCVSTTNNNNKQSSPSTGRRQQQQQRTAVPSRSSALLSFQTDLDLFCESLVPSSLSTTAHHGGPTAAASFVSPSPVSNDLAVSAMLTRRERRVLQLCPPSCPLVLGISVPRLMRSDRVDRCGGNLSKEVAALLQVIAMDVEQLEHHFDGEEDHGTLDGEDDTLSEEEVPGKKARRGGALAAAEKHLRAGLESEQAASQQMDTQVKVNVAARWMNRM